MKLFRSNSAIALATAAALSLMATPAMARGWHHRGHDRGIDAGEIFAGLLIIGGIAAVATAASNANKNKREQDYRDPESRDSQSRYPTDQDYRDYRAERDRSGGYGQEPDDRYAERGAADDWRGAVSMDAAVDVCAAELERGNRRIGAVDTVSRENTGYRVEGQMSDGREYSCTVDGDGRIRRVTVDGRAII